MLLSFLDVSLITCMQGRGSIYYLRICLINMLSVIFQRNLIFFELRLAILNFLRLFSLNCLNLFLLYNQKYYCASSISYVIRE